VARRAPKKNAQQTPPAVKQQLKWPKPLEIQWSNGQRRSLVADGKREREREHRVVKSIKISVNPNIKSL